MKLTRKDKDYLYNRGYSVEDVQQIEDCIKYTKYEDDNENRISRKKAIEILGRETWLSGMGRSAFHYTAYRNNENGMGIFFNSRDYFKN